MNDNERAVDMIERAQAETPLCECGAPMAPVWQENGMWLECSTSREPAPAGWRRFVARLVEPAHRRRLLFEAEAFASTSLRFQNSSC